MVEIVNLAANALSIVELIVFCAMAYLILTVFKKISKKHKLDGEILLFYAAITGYFLYRLFWIFATLPVPQANFFEIVLVGNLFLAIAGVFFFLGVRKLLKNARLDIDGRNH